MGDINNIGDPNERPIHKVIIDDFYIGETEITVAQFRAYCNDTETEMPEEPYWGWEDDYPIVSITWNDAIKYTTWLSKKMNRKIRLPYEAEWEYASRGGYENKKTIYSGSENLNDIGWFEDNSDEQAHSVATKKPNSLGLYDMTGNAYEWCMDKYDKDYYSKSPENNPKGAKIGDRYVIRGGAWWYKKFYCRISQRSHAEADYVSFVFGFRVASEN